MARTRARSTWPSWCLTPSSRRRSTRRRCTRRLILSCEWTFRYKGDSNVLGYLHFLGCLPFSGYLYFLVVFILKLSFFWYIPCLLSFHIVLLVLSCFNLGHLYFWGCFSFFLQALLAGQHLPVCRFSVCVLSRPSTSMTIFCLRRAHRPQCPPSLATMYDTWRRDVEKLSHTHHKTQRIDILAGAAQRAAPAKKMPFVWKWMLNKSDFI